MGDLRGVLTNLFRSVTSYVVLLLVSIVPALGASFTHTGTVAVWVNGQKTIQTVLLDSIKFGSLENDLVELEDVPPHFLPDKAGCFCFSESDKRFAFVHAYYHANEILLKFNDFLKASGLRLVKKTKISLAFAPGYFTGGGADSGRVYLRIPHSAFDFTILAHELAHEVHQTIIGKNLRDVLSDALDKQEWDKAAAQGLVSEGSANILAALVTNEESIGRHDYGDAAFRIDRFVRFPDIVPTNSQQVETMLNSPFILKAYPHSIVELKDMIIKPAFPELMDRPSSYLASAAINQPLWQAAKTYGAPIIVQIYLKALAALPNWQSHLELKNEILIQAQSINASLSDDLEAEFKSRGL